MFEAAAVLAKGMTTATPTDSDAATPARENNRVTLMDCSSHSG